MASLRPNEERSAKGETTRINPSVTFKQDRNIRTIIGRNDWRLDPNPDYHEPITVQVQNGKLVFFAGTPDTTESRRAAREIPQTEVPAYIIAELKKKAITVREHRPAVYEVKLTQVDGIEGTEVTELENDGQAVTLTPVEPELLAPAERAGKAVARAMAAGATA